VYINAGGYIIVNTNTNCSLDRQGSFDFSFKPSISLAIFPREKGLCDELELCS